LVRWRQNTQNSFCQPEEKALMSRNNAYTPGALNATLAVTSVTGAATLSGSGSQVRIYNAGTVEAFTAFAATVAGGGTKTATDDGGFSIGPAQVVFLTLPPGATTIAGITASGAGTTTLRINRGDGA
jgi:hypothetical protein